MAKQLDKLTKEFAPLKKSALALVHEVGTLETNIRHMLGLLGEACDEVTRCVGVLRKAGNPGTALKDFVNEKEVKAILATTDNCDKQLIQYVKRMTTMLDEGKSLRKSMAEMSAHLDDEISDRKKKKDRKLFSVDSASLPELEKLHKQIQETMRTLTDEVVTHIAASRHSHSADSTKAKLEKAVSQSADVQAQKDSDVLARRGLDKRLLTRAVQTAKSHSQDMSKHLSEVIKLVKSGDKGGAQDALAKATAARESLQTIAEAQASALKNLNLRSLGQTDEGQFILSATHQVANMNSEASKALDTILNKVKF